MKLKLDEHVFTSCNDCRYFRIVQDIHSGRVFSMCGSPEFYIPGVGEPFIIMHAEPPPLDKNRDVRRGYYHSPVPDWCPLPDSCDRAKEDVIPESER